MSAGLVNVANLVCNVVCNVVLLASSAIRELSAASPVSPISQVSASVRIQHLKTGAFLSVGEAAAGGITSPHRPSQFAQE